MPEGPEIRREADQIQDTLGDAPLKEVFFKFEHLKYAQNVLEGSRLLFVQTVGKGFLLHFDCGFSIYGHNQLYGKWMFAPKVPESGRDLRLLLRSDGGFALLYSASEIQFLPTEDVLEIPFVKNNSGLDVLNNRPSKEETLEYLSQSKFTQKGLSGLLLDQKFVLGMGNYLRSEVLFLAKIHPDKKIADLSSDKKKALALFINKVMVQAYEHEGVTNDLARATQMKKRKFFYEDYRFWVFNRENAPCYYCQSTIKRIEKNTRRLYFCPKCQRK